MRLRYILLLLPLLMSCRESRPDFFQDITGVYFNNTSGTMIVSDSIDVTFVYETGNVVEVPVRVQLLGRAAGQDRTLGITVTSENAEEGRDYILPHQAVMPAGASWTDYIIRLNRTEALKSEKKVIAVELHANDYFDLPVSHIIQPGDTVSTLVFKISFSDMFTKAPAAWDENLVGNFTQQKFELICKVLDIDPEDFNDSGKITLAKLLYISAEMTAYVREQVERKATGQTYDEDAFDRETGEPLTFGR